MILMLGQRWLTCSVHILAGWCGFGKGFVCGFGVNPLTVRDCGTDRRIARRGYASSRTVIEVIATGAFGRSRLLRGAVAIVSTTSRPLVTMPKMV